MDGSISSTSADLSKVVDLATLYTILPIGKALSGWMAGNAITVTLLFRHFGMFCNFPRLCLCSPFIVFILSNSFVPQRLVVIADLALWASTFLAQTNTCSLFTAVLPLTLVSSLIISDSISVSLSLCINCSFNCLSMCLYLHFHSSAFLFVCQPNMQNCNEFMVSLYCILNLLINFVKIPSILLHIFVLSVLKI